MFSFQNINIYIDFVATQLYFKEYSALIFIPNDYTMLIKQEDKLLLKYVLGHI